MKPIKNIEPFSLWMLRLGVLLFLISKYTYVFKSFDYKNINYIIDAVTILSGILLFFGGFSKKSTLTIVSGLCLCLLSLYQLYPLFINDRSITILLNTNVYTSFTIAATALLFAAKGNK